MHIVYILPFGLQKAIAALWRIFEQCSMPAQHFVEISLFINIALYWSIWVGDKKACLGQETSVGMDVRLYWEETVGIRNLEH